MTNTSEIATRLFAAFSALTITVTLLVSSFANPAATSLATVLA